MVFRFGVNNWGLNSTENFSKVRIFFTNQRKRLHIVLLHAILI